MNESLEFMRSFFNWILIFGNAAVNFEVLSALIQWMMLAVKFEHFGGNFKPSGSGAEQILLCARNVIGKTLAKWILT